LRPGVSYAKTLSESQQLAYGGRDFALWHNPEKVIERARRFFLNGRVEQILASDLSMLSWYGNIRHRVAHGHDDSRRKFDLATMGLAGRRVPGGRPGLFLRSMAVEEGGIRWIDKVGKDFVALAEQITP